MVMKMRVVTGADIIVCRQHELVVGDEILFRNIECIVTDINEINGVTFHSLNKRHPIIEEIRIFGYWYKTCECSYKFICDVCCQNEVEKEFEVCGECQG